MKNLLKCMFITLFVFTLTTSISAQNAPGWEEGVEAIQLVPVKKVALPTNVKRVFVGNLPFFGKPNSAGKQVSFYTNAQQNIFIRVLAGDKLIEEVKLSKPALKVLKQNKNLKAFLLNGYVTFFDEKAVKFDSSVKNVYLKYKLED